MKTVEFNKRFQFGTLSTTTNPNTGGPVVEFVPDFTVWGMFRRRSMSNNYQAIVNSLTDTMDIAIRHNKAITMALEMMVDGERYEILNISPDETAGFNKLDILTVRQINRNGAG